MNSAAESLTLASALRMPSARRWAVTLAGIFEVGGLSAAFNVLDPERSPTSLASAGFDAMLTPDPTSNLVWPLIWIMQVAYVAWQWSPIGRDDPRAIASGYPVAASLFLTGLWLHGTTTVPGSLLLILALSASLTWVLVSVRKVAPASVAGRLISQTPFALELGWAIVLTGAAVGAWLRPDDIQIGDVSPETWGIMGIVAMLAIGMLAVRYLPGRVFISAGMAWGFIFISYGRIVGPDHAYLVALVAAIAAGLILISGWAVFLWARARVRDRVH